MQYDSQIYGNLMSYKVYIRPAAQKLDGYMSATKTKHQKNIHEVLRILFVNGESTTWDMAKTHMRKIDNIRAQEKIYRRLLVGRFDRGKYSGGITDIGLILVGKHTKKPYNVYRLSLHGILYCMDALHMEQKEIDAMVAHYKHTLPKIFGKWGLVTKILGSDAYNLKILAKGLLLNNGAIITHVDNPIYELMDYIHIKYRRYFESITEQDLAEQMSYWFYTFLMYKKTSTKKMKRLFAADEELHKWYRDFFAEAESYYMQRTKNIKDSIHILEFKK